MKILFIFFSANPNSFTATQQKMYDQIKTLNKAGIDARGVFFTTMKGDGQYEYLDFIGVEQYQKNFLKYPKQRGLFLDALYNLLEKEYNHYDFIYLRYPMSGRKLSKISKKFGNKLIFEHQSKELSDLNTNLKLWFKKKITVSNLLNFAEFYLYNYLSEKLYRKSILKRNVGHGVAVTNEIRDSLIEESKGKYKVWVIPNGINSSEFNIRTRKKTDDKIIMLYLKGGANDVLWSGLDRLVNSIEKGNLQDKVELWIVGKKESGFQQDCVKQIGYKKGKELDEVFDKVDIGVNHLALYKIGLSESCNLKTREYFSRGLPFVYAANDTDLMNYPNGKKFCFKVANDDSLINFSEIKNFIRSIDDWKDVSEQMKEYSNTYLDWNSKAVLFNNMFEELKKT